MHAKCFYNSSLCISCHKQLCIHVSIPLYACYIASICFNLACCEFSYICSLSSVLHWWLCGDSAVPAGRRCLCKRLWQWAVDAAACCCHLWTHWIGAAPDSGVSFPRNFSPTFMHHFYYIRCFPPNCLNGIRINDSLSLHSGRVAKQAESLLDKRLVYINNANIAAAWLSKHFASVWIVLSTSGCVAV